ncbi:acetyl-CoA carboxylase biotin carboxyl carrier protein [Pedomonas mirosovicensis]|uniref:acetyl-CoA carboxylase biotin carboxyl carrier protein n=1 Tax=Pedomonas mirosovicensis TaxID=2908641 RepID=UPI00216A10EC|nr:acetyl-CoA carboxylase biotin carboxyl carrier protein [Pedomonas mirosovicensis]MCH8685571.1 acetyl-CoA carboxylase biotin carboxyl carrier protein [Pedomonas mirosovicensis]
MQVDKDLVRELAELLKDTDLSEIEVVDGERRVRVARQVAAANAVVAAPAPVQVAAAPAAPAAAAPAPAAPAEADLSKHPGVVPSPMVGTAYLAPEPGKPTFVSVGTQVKEGQTLLIIEAMKVMNPITAPRGGTVTQILVSNEQPVEFGEPLLIIE